MHGILLNRFCGRYLVRYGHSTGAGPVLHADAAPFPVPDKQTPLIRPGNRV